MSKFPKSVLLAGTVLVTPAPVNITNAWTDIQLKEPLKAMNSGASLEIDVTSAIGPSVGGHDVIERLKRTEDHFPKGCVEVRLTTKNQREVLLSNLGPTVSKTEAFVLLWSTSGIPTSQTFSSLSVRASCPITAAKIYWNDRGE